MLRLYYNSLCYCGNNIVITAANTTRWYH